MAILSDFYSPPDGKRIRDPQMPPRQPKRKDPEMEPEAKYPPSVIFADIRARALKVPWYRREGWQRAGAIGLGALSVGLAFTPGGAPLAKIVGGAALGFYATATEYSRIKAKRSVNEFTWWDLLLAIFNKLLKIFQK